MFDFNFEIPEYIPPTQTELSYDYGFLMAGLPGSGKGPIGYNGALIRRMSFEKLLQIFDDGRYVCGITDHHSVTDTHVYGKVVNHSISRIKHAVSLPWNKYKYRLLDDGSFVELKNSYMTYEEKKNSLKPIDNYSEQTNAFDVSIIRSLKMPLAVVCSVEEFRDDILKPEPKIKNKIGISQGIRCGFLGHESTFMETISILRCPYAYSKDMYPVITIYDKIYNLSWYSNCVIDKETLLYRLPVYIHLRGRSTIDGVVRSVDGGEVKGIDDILKVIDEHNALLLKR